jgi:hypothetical protein
MASLRRLWHEFTHKHATLKKDGLCEMDLCYGWLTRHLNVVIDFEGDYEDVVLRDVTAADMNRLFDSQSKLELRRTAVEIREGRTE